jgi:hypothetical protein
MQRLYNAKIRHSLLSLILKFCCTLLVNIDKVEKSMQFSLFYVVLPRLYCHSQVYMFFFYILQEICMWLHSHMPHNAFSENWCREEHKYYDLSYR